MPPTRSRSGGPPPPGVWSGTLAARLMRRRDRSMVRFGEARCHAPIRQADWGTGRPLRFVLRGCVRDTALAGLVAGSALLLPAPALAATQVAKPEQVAVTATTPAAGNAKVSPYAIANRKHQEARTADAAHSQKRASGGSAAKPKTVRADRH